MTRKISDYSKTIIYKMVCKDPSVTDVFYGHTTNISKMKYYWKKKGEQWTNWDLVELEKFPCNDKKEAKIKVNSFHF